MGKRGWIAAVAGLAVVGLGAVAIIENRRMQELSDQTDKLVAHGDWLLDCMNGGPKGQPSREPTDLELKTTQTLVSQRLREPESARFSKISVVTKECAPVVCGVVNARNGFGGMTGDRSFAVAGDTAYLADGGPSEMKTIQMFCEM